MKKKTLLYYLSALVIIIYAAMPTAFAGEDFYTYELLIETKTPFDQVSINNFNIVIFRIIRNSCVQPICHNPYFKTQLFKKSQFF